MFILYLHLRYLTFKFSYIYVFLLFLHLRYLVFTFSYIYVFLHFLNLRFLTFMIFFSFINLPIFAEWLNIPFKHVLRDFTADQIEPFYCYFRDFTADQIKPFYCYFRDFTADQIKLLYCFCWKVWLTVLVIFSFPLLKKTGHVRFTMVQWAETIF